MSEASIKVGDHITMPTPIYRHWWQFWLPRIVRWESREYVCTDSVSG